MNIQLIRNATLRLEYAGTTFLIDPMLAEQGAYPGLQGAPNSHLRNPTARLVVPVERLSAVDAVLVTHTHFDHWDEVARERLPRHLPVFVQHDADARVVAASGFTDVRVLGDTTTFRGITLSKTAGQHGSDAAMAAIGERLGEVSGVVFQHPEEPTLYVAGDTVWNEHVARAIRAHQPAVIVLNAGDAQITGLGSIIMNTQDVLAVHRAAPDATLVAAHLEGVAHAVLSRRELRAFAAEQGFADRLVIPDDGETLTL
ncbi:MBL fold metallo-hydrolase [Deinococcus sonorensis]|uniref:MBL fold metallo-hydrolase n=2 Tax=Deinococcus sonorensis TaxID=309891 RepID=A0AAU7U7U9_9DEIO